jgi:hypothetical protein
VKLDFVQKFSIYLFALISVAIMPFFNIDSISLPKFTILVTYGTVGLFYLLLNVNRVIGLLNVQIKLIFVIFIGLLIITFIASESPKIQLIFGRDGRYNGLLTYLSLITLFVIVSTVTIKLSSELILKSFVISTLIIISYSILQLLGLDPVKWDTVNVKYFGTFGNPNFLSSFIAIAVIPIVLMFNLQFKKVRGSLRYTFSVIFYLLMLFLIYKTYSLQGFIVLGVTSLFWIVLWSYKLKKFLASTVIGIIGLCSIFISFLGVLDLGPLSRFLYKSSVTSRGDFFRSGLAMAMDNWQTGVGMDSFADYYLGYRDEVAANRVGGELADSAHNYFIDIAASFGLAMLFLYITIILLTVFQFFRIFRRYELDYKTLTMFIIWVGVLTQSLVSPTNLVFLVLIFLISGVFIGSMTGARKHDGNVSIKNLNYITPLIFGSVASLILIAPINIRDNLILKANNLKRIDLLLAAVDRYPISTTGYNKVMVILNQQGEQELLINTARKAVNFNPRSSAANLFIFESPLSTEIEKNKALDQLRKLDPYNQFFDKFKS